MLSFSQVNNHDYSVADSDFQRCTVFLVPKFKLLQPFSIQSHNELQVIYRWAPDLWWLSPTSLAAVHCRVQQGLSPQCFLIQRTLALLIFQNWLEWVLISLSLRTLAHSSSGITPLASQEGTRNHVWLGSPWFLRWYISFQLVYITEQLTSCIIYTIAC